MRRQTQKLLQPQAGLVLAWAGFKDVAQAMALSLQEQPLDLTLPRSKVDQAARDRFRQIRQDREVEHRTDANEFIVAWFCRAELKPVALHLMSGGAAIWVEQWQYAGNASAVATARTVEASVGYLEIDGLEAQQLSLIVLKVLRDAIVAAPPSAGIGGEVKLTTITGRRRSCPRGARAPGRQRRVGCLAGTMRGASPGCRASVDGRWPG